MPVVVKSPYLFKGELRNSLNYLNREDGYPLPSFVTRNKRTKRESGVKLTP